MKNLKKRLQKIPGLNTCWRKLYRTTTFLRNLVLYRVIYRNQEQHIPIGLILVGYQAGYSLKEWLKKTGEFERLSLPVTNSPYVLFLRDVLTDKNRLGDEHFLRSHPYFQMAEVAVKYTGHFMGAQTEKEIFQVMREFFASSHAAGRGKVEGTPLLSARGHSLPHTPIILKKIKYSENYEIIDGHHRIAAAAVRGEDHVRALVTGEKTTYLQDLVLSGRQTHGDRELYQPLPQPEVNNWPLVRRCRDRFEMMLELLRQRGIETNGLTLLDCSCSYGWFLREFKRKGVTVLGIDRDPISVQIGRLALSLSPKDIIEADLVSCLTSCSDSFDIVLFLSILHHFALGQEKGNVGQILRQLDRIAKRVLFIDTGQNHEQWWSNTLPEWDDAYIVSVIRQHTSFTDIVKLGEDRDNIGPYQNQYQRSLFACLR